ncbi:Cof-type HAD-IIB family hydrolase [Irregularibacter muris]|uniref:Cof-type HAD-IIB family hydrolase n=1 Tax=Irregularibacter muris TaxID=1796619 RepID=A0AAE3KZ55_9FIRM|nr:Cof-type HAD-IIB family hydrolase [Irregularibacter muris]MCR1898695.1 Cof-type HAD-IIB family hydrolase [Irregularibacter muris]
MQYKLVGTDMDGTLLDDEKIVSNKTMEVLKKMGERGIHLALITGRIHYSPKAYAKKLNLKASIIGNNGAYIEYEDGTIDIVEIDKKLVMETLSHVEELGLDYNFVTTEKLYYYPMARKHTYYYGDNEMIRQSHLVHYEIIKSYKEIEKIKEPILKIHVFHNDFKKLEELTKTMPHKDQYDITSSGEDLIEFCHKDASKGNALKSIANYYNISMEEVVAIGDAGNDMSMIQEAGLGIAMGNAMDILKEKADYITGSNQEHGVAQVIEKMVL